MARKRKAADAPALASANPPQDIPSGAVHVDIAVMLPGFRQRHDGWNQQRLQRFLDVLAHTGCVQDAARVAGMSATGARRLKKKFPLFAEAWDDALGRAQQGLVAIAYQRAVAGRETVIIRKGEEYERRIQPSDAMLGLLLKRGDMANGGAMLTGELADLAGLTRDEILTLPEWRDQRMRFSIYGNKYQGQDPAEVDRKLNERFGKISRHLKAMALRGEQCPCCKAPLPPDWPKQSMASLVACGVIEPIDFFKGIELDED